VWVVIQNMGQFSELECLNDTTPPSRTCVCAQLFPTDCSSRLLVSLDINHPFIVSRLVFLPLDSCPTRPFACTSLTLIIWPRLMHIVHFIYPIPYSSRAWIDLHCTTAKPTSLSHARTKVPAVDCPVICSSWQQREYHTLSFGPIALPHTRTHPQAFVTVRISTLDVVAPTHTQHYYSRLFPSTLLLPPRTTCSTVRNRGPSVQQSRILAPGSAISRFPGLRLSCPWIYKPWISFFYDPPSSLYCGFSQGVCWK